MLLSRKVEKLDFPLYAEEGLRLLAAGRSRTRCSDQFCCELSRMRVV